MAAKQRMMRPTVGWRPPRKGNLKSVVREQQLKSKEPPWMQASRMRLQQYQPAEHDRGWRPPDASSWDLR